MSDWRRNQRPPLWELCKIPGVIWEWEQVLEGVVPTALTIEVRTFPALLGQLGA